jgi:ketosteroid isomerase-like protein
MKTIYSVMLLSVLLLLSACAPKVNVPADVQAVKQTMEAFSKAINAADAPGAVAMLTDKTVWLEPHMPAATGKDTVAKFLEGAFAQLDVDLTATVDDVSVTADLAVMRGTYKEKQTPKREDLPPVNASGNWMITLQRQADGTWKWDGFIVNSDQPMPGTTADGVEEQAVMQIERDLATASVKRDVAIIERSIAKEYTSVTDGKADDVKTMMAEFKAGAYQIESATVRDLKVHVFGDAAIATMTGASRGKYKGKDFANAYRGTDFFIKRDGRWQIVSGQSTTIKQ